MRNRALLSVGLLALVGAAFFAASPSSRAQGPGIGQLPGLGAPPNMNYYNPSPYQAYFLFYPYRGGGRPRSNYRRHYGGHFLSDMAERETKEPRKAPKDTHAHLLIRVPAGAELWFNGTKVTGEGEVRKFASPVLTLGQRYSYEVRAQWKQNGQTITKTHELTVKAGAHIDVYFTPDDKEK